MAKVLYAHQEQMISEVKNQMKSIMNNINNGVADEKSILCQAPCGFGKSLIIAFILGGAIAKENHVLFLVHRTFLVEQIIKEIDEWGLDIDFIDIDTNMRMGKSSVLSDNELPEYDIIVTDEAHHASASTYQRIYERFPQAWKIGFTATPWRGAGAPLSETYKHLILGPQVNYLIEREYLSQFSVVTQNLLTKQMRDQLVIGKKGDYTKNSLTAAFSSFDYTSPVDAYKMTLAGKKAIAYLSSIDAAVRLTESFLSAGIAAAVIHSNLGKAQVKKAIHDFRTGDILVLCNVDMVGEGFDVPDCEGVILLRPTQSLALHIQQSMRCMRKLGDKQAIILDLVGNTNFLGSPDKNHDWNYYFKGNNILGKKETVKKVKIPLEVEPKKEFTIIDLVLQIHRKGWKRSALPFQARKEGLITSNQDLIFIAKVCNYKMGWVKAQPEYTEIGGN